MAHGRKLEIVCLHTFLSTSTIYIPNMKINFAMYLQSDQMTFNKAETYTGFTER